MDIIYSIIQGIIQGLTEFLPVSSSGHLSLAQHFMPGINLEATGITDVMFHIGTLIAVFIFYYELIWRLICEFFRMIGDIFTAKFKWKEMNHDRTMVVMLIIALLPLFLIFIPIGNDMDLKDLFDSVAQDADIILEGICLLITGALLTFAVRKEKQIHQSQTFKTSFKKQSTARENYNIWDAVSIGFTQFIALLPGISRSGSTLSTGLFRGLSKQKALDFSFILGIPAILAAALLQTKDAISSGVEVQILPMIIGMIISAVVGILAIKLLRWLVKENKLSIFAIYTFAVGSIAIIIGIIENVIK